MRHLGCLVIEHIGSDGRRAHWQIYVGDQSQRVAADASPQDLATQLKSLIPASGIKQARVVLAPASTSCFFVKLSVSDSIDRRDRVALSYELEGHLPIDAESMVADFVPLDSSPQGVHLFASLAIPLEPWQRIVDAFEAALLPVRSLVPAAVLAVQALTDKGGRDKGGRPLLQGTQQTGLVLLMLVEGDRCDCIGVRDETIVSWQHLPVEAAALQRHSKLDWPAVNHVIVVGADPSQRTVIQAISADAQVLNLSVESLVRQGAQRIMDHRSLGWFELRRDRLGPSDPLRAIGPQLYWVAVAAAICFVAVAIGGWWRTSRIEAEIANLQREQAALFQQAFPDARVPGSILRRVRSDHARVLNSRGQNTNVMIPPSATQLLRAVVSSLPKEVRFHITSVDISRGIIKLDLLVRRIPDASVIANAIEQGGFKVLSPKVNQSGNDPNQYNALIEATWIETSDLSGATG